jgi:hypothetical protein
MALTGDPRKFTCPPAPLSREAVSALLSFPCGLQAAVKAASARAGGRGVTVDSDGSATRCVHTVRAGSFVASGSVNATVSDR